VYVLPCIVRTVDCTVTAHLWTLSYTDSRSTAANANTARSRNTTLLPPQQQQQGSSSSESSTNSSSSSSSSNSSSSASWWQQWRLRPLQQRMAVMKRLFVWAYPLLHALYEASFLSYHWLYLFNRSAYFSPLLRALGQVSTNCKNLQLQYPLVHTH
jgi:Pex2 / Pex12 amino terminal region